jgi:BirA family biotin operon repressor/biotin-[acetyl-CoA-carboxylase] ligase
MIEPLNAERIRAGLAPDVRAKIKSLEVVVSLASTNGALVTRAYPDVGCSDVLLAEFQTAGRGRRGRSWIAPPGGAICLSLNWTFAQMPRDAGALSLAIGVCVVRALRRHGVTDPQLKWPNDILIGGRKLGGILIELRAEASGPACAVVGIGLNVSLGAALLEEIAALGLPATDLVSAGLATPSRNTLAASVIEHCIRGLQQFEQAGLQAFMDEWRGADALRDKAVTAFVTEEGIHGIARGIDLSGALLVETAQGLKKFHSGDVTVRAAA